MPKIAIITARGGSKRIPRKNIKEFCGKPILAYSITAALESGVFESTLGIELTRERHQQHQCQEISFKRLVCFHCSCSVVGSFSDS